MGRKLASLFRCFRDGIALERDRAQLRLLIVCSVVDVIVFVALLAFIAIVIWNEWPRLMVGDHERMRTLSLLLLMTYQAIYAPLMLALGLLSASNTAGPSGAPTPTRAFVWALAGAIDAGDPVIAPRASVGADHDVSVDEPQASGLWDVETLDPLAYPMRSQVLPDVTYVLGALGGVLLVLLGLVVLTIGRFASPSQRDSFEVAFQVFTLHMSLWLSPISTAVWSEGFVFLFTGGVCVFWALLSQRSAQMARQGFSAQVSPEGITVRQQGPRVRERRLLWHDVRGFARIHYRDDMLRDHTVYLLRAVDQDVLWESPAVNRYLAPEDFGREEAMRASAARLVRYALRYVSAPLVDISAALETALIGVAGPFYGAQVWNLTGRALYLARQAGDSATASHIWSRLHPNKREPSTFSLYMGAGLHNVRLSPTERERVLTLTKALLPYYPAPDAQILSPRMRGGIRAYWRFAIGQLIFLMLLALLVIAADFMRLHSLY
ncbi:MAG TPA: hypothetical protein VF812_03445 [Ktedonobacterales bacterium]